MPRAGFAQRRDVISIHEQFAGVDQNRLLVIRTEKKNNDLTGNYNSGTDQSESTRLKDIKTYKLSD